MRRTEAPTGSSRHQEQGHKGKEAKGVTRLHACVHTRTPPPPPDTEVGDCSHEIERHLLLRRKAMTKLDSVLKSRGITMCEVG